MSVAALLAVVCTQDDRSLVIGKDGNQPSLYVN